MFSATFMAGKRRVHANAKKKVMQTETAYTSFSLSRNKEINLKPFDEKRQELEML